MDPGFLMVSARERLPGFLLYLARGGALGFESVQARSGILGRYLSTALLRLSGGSTSMDRVTPLGILNILAHSVSVGSV